MRSLQEIQTGNQEFAIFAAQPHPTEQVMKTLATQGIRFQVLLGSWKGEAEVSYMVQAEALPFIEANGFLDEQETVLILGAIDSTGRRPALMVTLVDEGESLGENLGYLTECTKQEAMSSEAYTYNPHIDKFFIIK